MSNTKTTPQNKTRKDESMISIAELKAKCRALGIKGYSKKKKNEIVELLLSNFPDDAEIQKIALLVKNVKLLKKICYQLGIRGYSKKKKTQLVEIISVTQKHKQQLTNNIAKAMDENPNSKNISIPQDIIFQCFEALESKGCEMAVEVLVKHLTDNYPLVQKDIVKAICKRIRKIDANGGGGKYSQLNSFPQKKEKVNNAESNPFPQKKQSVKSGAAVPNKSKKNK
jgi:hypothetical protein